MGQKAAIRVGVDPAWVTAEYKHPKRLNREKLRKREIR